MSLAQWSMLISLLSVAATVHGLWLAHLTRRRLRHEETERAWEKWRQERSG